MAKTKKIQTNVVVATPTEVLITTPIKTSTISDVRKVCQTIGDNLTKTYNKTQDLKAAATAISAYSTAISAVKAQLIYKKMTGSPARIDFFETKE